MSKTQFPKWGERGDIQRVARRLNGEANQRLAHFAGYGPEEFASDLISAFQRPAPDMEGLHDTAGDWSTNASVGHSDGKSIRERMGTGQSADYYKLLHRLKRSKLKDQFMQMSGGDSVKAAEAFVEWANKTAQTQKSQQGRGGRGGKGDDGTSNNLAKTLQKAMAEHGGTQQAEPIPFTGQKGSNDQSATGPLAGTAHAQLVAHAMRIAELLPKVRKQYEFAATKAIESDPSPWPEDDIDVREMRSYSEIRRLPKAYLAMDDDLFFHKLARKELPVLEHRKLRVMPRKFTLLLDVSGSMESMRSDGYSSVEWATAVCIALLEQASYGCNEVVFIAFDGGAHTPVKGTPQQIADYVWKCQFSGGGTCFESAFRASDKHDPEAVVIVTDGGSSFSSPPKGKLHSLMCGGTSPQLKAASKVYKEIA